LGKREGGSESNIREAREKVKVKRGQALMTRSTCHGKKSEIKQALIETVPKVGDSTDRMRKVGNWR